MLKSSIILHRKYSIDWLITFIFICVFILIILLSKDIPFLLTMGYVGSIANRIYDSNFSQIIFDTDNGMPPLYSAYLAFIWMIFGKSLLIMHIVVLPFLIGIIIQLKRIAIALYPEISLLSLFLLLLFEPTFLTVCLIGRLRSGNYFFLSVCTEFYLFQKKNILFILSLLLIPILNSRGFTIVFWNFLL